MKDKIEKLKLRIKVLDEQKRRDRKRLKKIVPLVKEIYNITSQIDKQ